MKDNRTPTHLSTTTDIRDMLKEMAEREERTMRKVLERIVRKEYEKFKEKINENRKKV